MPLVKKYIVDTYKWVLKFFSFIYRYEVIIIFGYKLIAIMMIRMEMQMITRSSKDIVMYMFNTVYSSYDRTEIMNIGDISNYTVM